jgi:N-acetylneuraminic acid mutarotase
MKNLTKILAVLYVAIIMIVVACKKEDVLIPAKSSDKTMSSFLFGSLTPNVNATITGTTVTATVPFNVDVTSLVPTVSVASKATVSPASGVAQNFTNTVTYTVTAEDGTTQNYSVTVTKGVAPKSSAKDITKFSFAALSPAVDATIDATTKTITATVPAATDVTKLVPTITISDKATVSPATGVATDFSKEVSYTVTAEDASTAVWKVNVTVTVASTGVGTWTQKRAIPNDSISLGRPVALVFGDKAIIGFGAKFPNLSKAIWEYTSSTDTWVRKANFPGEARFGVSSFVANGKGYIVGGSAQLFSKIYNELWEYDPATDKWTKKSAYPESSGFVYGVAGTVANKGYIGTGTYPINSAWYEYDPSTDKWTKKTNMPVSRGFNSSFVINGKVYVGMGTNTTGSGGYQNDLYEYDPTGNSWKQMASLPGGTRTSAFGFSLNGRGYIAGGGYQDAAKIFEDVYEFDPTTNKWTQKATMKSSSSQSGCSFVVNGKGYIGLDKTYNTTKDLWMVEF